MKIPIEVQRSMAQRTQKAAASRLGDRALPQAGLIFFIVPGVGSGDQLVELTLRRGEW